MAKDKPLPQQLTDTLILKSATLPDDIERLAAFNAIIHGETAGALTRNVMADHPASNPDYWLYVEDTTTNQIVSSLVLIPWTWHYEDVELRAGEMGIVGTLPAYRHKGLIRALTNRFNTLLDQGDFDLSHIQGIPYYYSLFGYEYALPLEGGWRVELHNIPDEVATAAQRYTFRKATVEDIPTLQHMYDATAESALSISAVRTPEMWRFLLTQPSGSDTCAETWFVLDGDEPVAYWRIEDFGFGPGLNIKEASTMRHPAAMAVLHHLKKLAGERDKPFIKLTMHNNHILLATSSAWGAHDMDTYCWQIRFPDPARFLRKIAPVLERRIANSPLTGMTETVTISLYKEVFALNIADGKVTSVDALGFRDDVAISIPPKLFVPLALGTKSRAELQATHKDVSIWGQSQVIIDVLFPKMDSYIYCMY